MTSHYTWKMVCTNDERHDRFVTCATVLEEWEVDCFGDHGRTKDFLDTVHDPSPDNIWTCAVCGAYAERRDLDPEPQAARVVPDSAQNDAKRRSIMTDTNDTNDTNNANEKKLYVLTRTRLENPDPRHGYSERDTIQEYLQMRQDLPATWVRKIGRATLYSESDARKWHLFATSEKERMEPYVNPCADGHELYLDSENCGIDGASHDQSRRLTNMCIGLVVYCKKCGMSVDIDLEHKLEDSVWDAIDMNRTAST